MILWVYFLRAPVVKITLCLTTQLASHHWSVRVKPQTEKSENPQDWKLLKICGKWNYLKEAEQLIVFSCWTMWSPTHVQVLGIYAGSWECLLVCNLCACRIFSVVWGGRGTEGKSLNDNSIFELKSSPSAKFIYESTFYSEGCREVSLLHNHLLFNM